MKPIILIVNTILMTIIISVVAGKEVFGQGKMKNLNFNLKSVSSVNIESKETGSTKLIIDVYRPMIKNIDRAFIRIGTSPGGSDVLVKVIDKKVLLGTEKDEAINQISINEDYLRLIITDLKRGKYYVTVKIQEITPTDSKEWKSQMYIGEKSIKI